MSLRTAIFLEALEETLTPCLFWLLTAAHIPWLVTLTPLSPLLLSYLHASFLKRPQICTPPDNPE